MRGSSAFLDQVLYFLFFFFFNVNFRFQQVDCSSYFPPSSHNSSTLLCHPKHSSALLQFKHTISVEPDLDYVYYFEHNCYPKTNSWKEGSNCCSWDGVTCDKEAGYVIGLDLSSSCLAGTIDDNNSLFNLSHLQWLNLADKDFTDSSISSKFGQFRDLTLLNLSSSGFKGVVPSELSHLSKLAVLDLSVNYGLYMHGQQSFEFLAENLTRLSVLDLSFVNMSLVAPVSLSNLSSLITVLHLKHINMSGKMPDNVFCLPILQELDLSYNADLTGYLPKSNWSSPLRILDLSASNFTGVISDSIGNLKFLEEIYLQDCNFVGSIPASIANLHRLTKLDLSFNSFIGSIPASIGKLNQLTRLDLSFNHFRGSIPTSIGNLTHLSQMKLEFNYFTCQIPDIFGNLSKLTTIYLSNNNLTGKLPLSLFNHNRVTYVGCSSNRLTGPFPSHVGGLSNLVDLDLSNNFIDGEVPSWLFTLPFLYSLKLTNNQLTGHIDRFNILTNSLEHVDLGNNKLNGSIPGSIFELEHLTFLDLSANNLSGTVLFDRLSKLENLWSLNLSHNSLLSLSSSNSNINPDALPNLEFLSFSSCNVTEFPIFLRSLKNLSLLDLSNNKIHSLMFKNLTEGWDNLSYLSLSKNNLTCIDQHPWKNVYSIDLRNNLLQGSLLLPPPSTKNFLVSKNRLTGRIPPSICNLSSLYCLDLSNNNFNGEIPECLGNFSVDLEMLHLQMNNLHGRVPDTFVGSSIKSLDLNGNKLEGALPRSLANCSYLEVINMANNKIRDTFPCWLGTLPELQVLVLRENEFYGRICDSKTTFFFSKLRIIDLSHNKLIGTLPRTLFENMKAMVDVDEEKSKDRYMGGSIYEDSIILILKGQVIEMERILNIFTTIDLSNNQLQGGIPEVLGNFKSLLLLNFSHNRFTGNIPLQLGNLTTLESLDLSSNELDGCIPKQLKSLTFLAILNLSYNKLSGLIPQGGQFYTYQSDSFVGNLGLCGMPLPKKCSNDWAPQPSNLDIEDDAAIKFDWKIAMMGYACGIVIGISIGYIVFSTGKPRCFVRMFPGEQKRKIGRPGPRRRR